MIALTHMRWPNNMRLAEEVEGIDMLLCGHDHFYKAAHVKKTFVVNSGCDFKQFRFG